jgi:hypothetical protein
MKRYPFDPSGARVQKFPPTVMPVYRQIHYTYKIEQIRNWQTKWVDQGNRSFAPIAFIDDTCAVKRPDAMRKDVSVHNVWPNNLTKVV